MLINVVFNNDIFFLYPRQDTLRYEADAGIFNSNVPSSRDKVPAPPPSVTIDAASTGCIVNESHTTPRNIQVSRFLCAAYVLGNDNIRIISAVNERAIILLKNCIDFD